MAARQNPVRWIALGAAAVAGWFALMLLKHELVPAWRQQLTMGSFHIVSGEISRCEVKETPPKAPQLLLDYTYRVAGQERSGSHWRAPPFFWQREDYEQLCRELLTRRTVGVYVDPLDPARAALERGLDGADILLALFFAGCAAVSLAFAWGGVRMTLPGRRRTVLIESRQGQIRIHALDHAGAHTLRWLLLAPWGLLAFLCIGFGNNPPLDAVVQVLVATAVLALASLALEWRSHRTGRSALVIEPADRSLLLPKRLWRERIRFSFDEADKVQVFGIQHATEASTETVFLVALLRPGRADDGVVVSHSHDLEQAQALASLLAREIDSARRSRPVQLSLEPLPFPSVLEGNLR